MSAALLATKIRVPPLRSHLVNRPHLIRRLNDGITQRRRLTLISAPAGYGKSTLLSEWVSQLDLPAAWLTLEKGENNPAHFWSYFFTALATIPYLCQASIGETTLLALQSPRPPAMDELLASLVNNLSKLETVVVVVLDDLHTITEGKIHQGLVFLIDHLPLSAAGLHLVFSSRGDPPWPLARWRVRDELNELRPADLRFSPTETTQFLNQFLHFRLPAQDVHALQERTEGWIAGLQMAAVSIQGRLATQGSPGVSRFIETFTGSNRYILDYLIEEVISQQTDRMRDFLQDTSILERLTAPLCDALTGRQDSQAILDQVEQANLFLIPLDDERRWYRYHHLFAYLLCKRLKQARPDYVSELHRRACNWYAANEMINDAIIHALDAGDVPRVNELVSGNILHMLEHTELMSMLRHFEEIPDQEIASKPWLGVAYAWVKAHIDPSGDLDGILRLTKQGITGIDDLLESQRLTGHLAAIQAYAAWLKGESIIAVEFSRDAINNLPESDRLTRAHLFNIEGLAWSDLGNQPAAQRSFEASAGAGQGTSRYFDTYIHTNLAIVHLLQGRLQHAFSLCQNILSQVDPSDQDLKRSVYFTYAYGLSSLVQCEWNDLEASVLDARKGVALAEQWKSPYALSQSLYYLSKALCAAGQLEEAFATNQRARRLAENISSWYSRFAECELVWLNLVKGDIPAAAEALAAIDPAVMERDKHGWCLKAKASLLYAQGRYADVITELEEVIDEKKGTGEILLMMNLLLIYALALQATGCQEEALGVLSRCLEIGKPGGYVRIFVDWGAPTVKLLQIAASRGIETEYIAKLLLAFNLTVPRGKLGRLETRKPRSNQSLDLFVEPLSERELQVLRLLDSPLTSEEIGRELFISVNTTRTHIRNIYAKLGVKRRGDAVQLAKKLQLH